MSSYLFFCSIFLSALLLSLSCSKWKFSCSRSYFKRRLSVLSSYLSSSSISIYYPSFTILLLFSSYSESLESSLSFLAFSASSLFCICFSFFFLLSLFSVLIALLRIFLSSAGIIFSTSSRPNLFVSFKRKCFKMLLF